MKTIDSFTGKYYFLSNFYNADVWYNGYTFKNNEAAFQAMKCPERIKEFVNLNPSEAKRLGRRVKLRTDWEDVKEQIMYDICFSKFYHNQSLAVKLINTGDAILIEGNTWGDKVCGKCDGIGENKLGNILMSIRKLLQESR